MAIDSTLLPDRPRHAPGAARLDWLALTDAFELACLVKCGSTALPRVRAGRGSGPAGGGEVEFNQEPAAERMKQLCDRLRVPVTHQTTTGGLRRRYQLHRLRVPETARVSYLTLLETGWWQGRREVLAQPATGGSSPSRRIWRPRLAAAAWRSALLAGGRHVRKHILGVRLNDQDLAAVLVRGGGLLGVTVSLVPGAGCLVVSVPDGPDKCRILHHAALPAPVDLAC